MSFDSLIFSFSLIKFQGHTQVIIAPSLPLCAAVNNLQG